MQSLTGLVAAAEQRRHTGHLFIMQHYKCTGDGSAGQCRR